MNHPLELRAVCVCNGDGEDTVPALDHVDLTVSPGEFAAVVGPSGSGKSTLLAVAGALTRPHSGTVSLGGQQIESLPDRELTAVRRDPLGLVFQSGNLPSSLTASEQLELAARIIGRRGRKSAAELLESVGMGHRAGNRPDTLSGGERQRVAIARALVGDPQVLLVDEPTAALDRARSHEIVTLLAAETRGQGLATVMVTHNLSVLEHCDTVYEMVDGRLPLATAAAD